MPGIVGVCQTFECHCARDYDISTRASQESRAIVIGLFFENRHHIDKALERIESDNRVKESGLPRRSRSFAKAERKIIRAVRCWHDHPDRSVENSASSSCLRPRHENTDLLLAFSKPADKTLLGFIEVSGEKERQQIQTVHLVGQDIPAVGAGCVCCGSLVKDLPRLEHIQPPSFNLRGARGWLRYWAGPAEAHKYLVRGVLDA